MWYCSIGMFSFFFYSYVEHRFLHSFLHDALPIWYVMTEFLVNRSYADKYNMIACAMGHHIMESRWLHNSQYLDEYIHVWRSEEHTSELQSRPHLVCRLLLEKKNKNSLTSLHCSSR